MLTKPSVRRLMTLLLALALAVPAGAYGAVSTAAAAEPTVAPGGTEAGPDDAAILARAEALAAMDAAERDGEIAEMGAELELDVAELSGLAEALGGRDAARAALAQGWAPLIATVTGTLGAEQPPVAIASLVAVDTDGPSIGGGMFGGYMVVALGADGVISASNDLPDGESASGPVGESGEMTAEISRDRASMAMDASHERDGLKTVLKTTVSVAPCPAPDGTFEASASIDVSATKGSVGQNGTLEVRVTGQVDDDARLVSSDMIYRMQWAKFGGPRGEYVDVGGTLTDATLRRSGGAATPKLASDAANFGAFNAALIQAFVSKAAQKGWESGRCVRLDATPSAGPKDLDPGQVVSVMATPRSKIDGGATGGSVTASLTAGGATVAPAATKVPADATFSYVAPDQAGKSGTVSLEARSRRGVGKATLELTTGADERSYRVVETPGGRSWSGACIVSLAKGPIVLKWKGATENGVFTLRPTSETKGVITEVLNGKQPGYTFKYQGKGRYRIEVVEENPDESPRLLDVVYATKGKAKQCVPGSCITSTIAGGEAMIPLEAQRGTCPGR
jgi:hypothetical protein